MRDAATPRVLLLAPQLVALIAVVLGFRHAMGLPADLRANWVFHIAWAGDARHYVSGVKRFGITGIVLPTVLLLAPIYATLLGVERAGAHALLGLVLGAVLLQAAMLGIERLPLACAYAPDGTLKTRGPVYLFGGIIAIYWVGRLERAALSASRADSRLRRRRGRDLHRAGRSSRAGRPMPATLAMSRRRRTKRHSDWD